MRQNSDSGASSPGTRSTLSRACRAGTAAACLVLTMAAAAAFGAEIHSVVQRDRAFGISAIEIAAGDVVHFTNDDEFIHQISVRSPKFSFESAEQQPGEAVDVRFPNTGTFSVICEIHPKMHLAVTVR